MSAPIVVIGGNIEQWGFLLSYLDLDAPIVVIGGNIEQWGFLLSYLDLDDPRSAREQFNEKHVSGWHAFPGFELDNKTKNLLYAGDPPTKLLSIAFFRSERVCLYEYDWVLVMQKDGSWEVCRMD